jgi:hypothetical protein
MWDALREVWMLGARRGLRSATCARGCGWTADGRISQAYFASAIITELTKYYTRVYWYNYSYMSHALIIYAD